jgi:tape measure domain-containing protein
MASKQVSEILVRLGIQGLQGLDKLKSSFRELEKSLGPSAATIERARESIIAFGREGRNTEQVIKGQIEALRGLQSQTERGSTAWAELAGDIERFRQASRRTDGEIQVLRQSILSVAAGANQSQQSLRSYITDLGRLRGEATITGSVFSDLGRDIAELTAQLQQAEIQTIQTSRAFGRVLGQALASTSAGARKQLQDLKLLIDEQRGIVDSIDQQSAKERRLAENIEARAAAQERLNRALVQQRQLMYEQSVRTGRESVRTGAAAFAEGSGLFDFRDAARRFGDLPDTTAALNQELAELSERLLNTNRSSSAYVDVSNRIAEVQRELRREITGTAEAFKQLDIAQTGAERRAEKLAGIQEYYSTQGPLAPGVGGYRDPVTGAMIAAGARTPGRIRVDEAAYPTPIGPQPLPEMGRRAQESIDRALDDVNRIYENAKVERAQIQAKYDQIEIDKTLAQADEIYSLQEQIHKKELNDFNRRLEARDKLRRRRLTTGQAVQSAGAIISGGIFGGPEGFVGGLGGFAAGLAIPGLGPVGGAFAGAAAGAQLGGLRQAAGAAAEYAAEIRRLQLALQGVVYSFEDYRTALKAIESTSQQFNIPILQSTQQFTKLTAAVVGSGGTIKDAENTFKGLSASVLATGGSIQDVNGALVAAAQVFSKGKVSAEELRGQIGERLAGAFALFAESSGKSTKELDADLQAGEVTLAQFVQFVEFSLKKYGRTAQIIADSPEQAGARLDLALKNLQKNIGNALGPSGAAFQDFAARSIRGIDRVINKLIELRAIQPGAGFYQEQVLGKRMSIEQLEKAVLEAGARESELRTGLADVGLGFFANLSPEIAKASKEVKILEEALVKLRLIEKETNKERKQRQDDEAKAEKEKLGQQYLQAVEQREESLFDARRQREEQIAKIRKDAVEQAAQIERQLGDERRQIERDIERTRREMEFGAGEIDRLRRLAAGEDPEVIEAERKAAEISQRATEDRIKIQEDLLDKELEQQRTIADFQKNTAKQIAEANEGYAKRVGEIQRDFAKASAKIIEEGSGVAAKRITLAAQIVSQVLQRTSLNQQRTQFGLQPIGEPSGFMGGRPVYSGLGSNEVPEQIQRIDANLEQLLRKLSQQTQGRQSSLPARSGIGEQFLSLLGAERGYEDVAGLQPLPLQKMLQQIGRPFTKLYRSIEEASQSLYPFSRREVRKMLAPNPERTQRVLGRAQRVEEIRMGWDPLEAEWKERQNRSNPNPRSRLSAASLDAFEGVVRQVSSTAFKRLIDVPGNIYGILDDISDYLTEAERQVIKSGILEQLQQGANPARMPIGGNRNTGRANIKEAVKQLTIEAIEELRLGTRGGAPARNLYGAPGSFERLLEQPRITPGVESQFEGAMLPGRGFNISRLTRNYGSIASASPGPLGLIAQAIQGAAPTSQMRQQAAQQQTQQVNQNELQQQFGVLSEITQTSRETYRTLQDQTREIELQIKYLSEGHEPAIARELTTLQQSYETQKRRLDVQKQALIDQGQNVNAVSAQYNLELKTLETLNQQNQELAIQNERRNKAIQDAQQLRDAVVNPLQQGLTQSFDLLINGTENWGNSLRQIAATVLQDIARQLIQIYVINQAISAIGKLFPMPGGTIPVAAVAANGMAFAKNGIQPFAMGGIVNKPTLFKYADGGAGRFGLMGEAGPEAIIPLKRGRDGKLGVAGGGSVAVTVNVDAQGTKVQGDNGQGQQLGRAVAAAVQAELIKQKRPGGLLA